MEKQQTTTTDIDALSVNANRPFIYRVDTVSDDSNQGPSIKQQGFFHLSEALAHLLIMQLELADPYLSKRLGNSPVQLHRVEDGRGDLQYGCIKCVRSSYMGTDAAYGLYFESDLAFERLEAFCGLSLRDHLLREQPCLIQLATYNSDYTAISSTPAHIALRSWAQDQLVLNNDIRQAHDWKLVKHMHATGFAGPNRLIELHHFDNAFEAMRRLLLLEPYTFNAYGYGRQEQINTAATAIAPDDSTLASLQLETIEQSLNKGINAGLYLVVGTTINKVGNACNIKLGTLEAFSSHVDRVLLAPFKYDGVQTLKARESFMELQKALQKNVDAIPLSEFELKARYIYPPDNKDQMSEQLLSYHYSNVQDALVHMLRYDIALWGQCSEDGSIPYQLVSLELTDGKEMLAIHCSSDKGNSAYDAVEIILYHRLLMQLPALRAILVEENAESVQVRWFGNSVYVKLAEIDPSCGIRPLAGVATQMIAKVLPPAPQLQANTGMEASAEVQPSISFYFKYRLSVTWATDVPQAIRSLFNQGIDDLGAAHNQLLEWPISFFNAHFSKTGEPLVEKVQLEEVATGAHIATKFFTASTERGTDEHAYYISYNQDHPDGARLGKSNTNMHLVEAASNPHQLTYQHKQQYPSAQRPNHPREIRGPDGEGPGMSLRPS